MPTQSISGRTMHYLEAGNGPTLVLLHGFPLDARMWDAQVGALSASCRVIAPDFPGFGRSTSGGPFTMESLATDVHALLDAICDGPIVLAGLSMGGYAALAYERKYPATLRGLALIDTMAQADSAEVREQRDKLIEMVRTSGAMSVGQKMLERLVAPSTKEGRPDVMEKLKKMMEGNSPQAVEHALVALRDRPDQTDLLPSISTPTMVVVGEHDVIAPPSIAEQMVSLIPQARLVTVPDAGHMSPMEQPDAVNAALLKFVTHCARV